METKEQLLRSIAENSIKNLKELYIEDFIIDFSDDSFCTLDRSQVLFEKTAEAEAYKAVVRMLDKQCSVEEIKSRFQDKLLNLASFPKNSTSTISNFLHVCLVTAYGNAITIMDNILKGR